MRDEIKLFTLSGPGKCRVSLPALCIVISMVLSFMSPALGDGEEMRFPDTGKILAGLGFEKAVYDPVRAMDMQMDPAVESEMARIEGEATVDTVEEFLTAVYYSRRHVGRSTAEILEKELPQGKTGALRLCSIWLFKIVEYPAGAERFRKAVRLIRGRSKLTNSEIVDFYQEAIRNRVYGNPVPVLGPAETEQVRQLVLLYLMDPADPAHYNNLRKFVRSAGETSPKKADAIIAYLKGISVLVASKIQ